MIFASSSARCLPVSLIQSPQSYFSVSRCIRDTAPATTSPPTSPNLILLFPLLLHLLLIRYILPFTLQSTPPPQPVSVLHLSRCNVSREPMGRGSGIDEGGREKETARAPARLTPFERHPPRFGANNVTLCRAVSRASGVEREVSGVASGVEEHFNLHCKYKHRNRHSSVSLLLVSWLSRARLRLSSVIIPPRCTDSAHGK